MILMQYSFTLPADYDMDIIDQRIKDNGPMLDRFPGLNFKAFLSARQDDTLPTRENLYAPFYAWDDEDAISNFLCSKGFDALCKSFGRPTVHKWLAWAHHSKADITSGRYANRLVKAIPAGSDLTALRKASVAAAQNIFETDQSVLAVVCGFDPRDWTEVTFALHAEKPEASLMPDIQLYRVGHISTCQ